MHNRYAQYQKMAIPMCNSPIEVNNNGIPENSAPIRRIESRGFGIVRIIVRNLMSGTTKE